MNASVFVFTPADVFGLVLLVAAAFLAGMTIVPRTTIALLVLFIGLGVAKCAQAEPVYGLHVASQHIPDKGQNNFNPGAYVRFGDTSVGAYHNSYRDTTVYVSQAYSLGYGFDLVGGIAYGYQRSGTSRGALTPMGGITYTFPVKILGMQPKVFAIPPTPKNSAVLHLAMEF